ncbi:MAG: PqqD family protein, partial [Actinomycetes bacterium]
MSTPENAEVLDLVLVPRAGLTVVPVHDELVVYDGTGDGNLHRLDPRAALVWQLLDGTATVRQTALEIAEAVGADPIQVTADVASLVRDLRDLNLVATPGSKPARRRARASRAPSSDDDASEAEPAQQTSGVLVMKRTPCFAALEAEGWHATDAVSAGPYVVGIRTSDESTRALVRTRFEPLLDPVTVADPNFSQRPAVAAAPGRPGQLAQVYAGCTLAGRHRTTVAALSQL